jgi:hypothetical protein
MHIMQMETQTDTPRPRGWTPERTALARQLWAKGISASRIAARLDGAVSRCAVLSKMYRDRAPNGRAAPAAPRPLAGLEMPLRRSRRDVHRVKVRLLAPPDQWREAARADAAALADGYARPLKAIRLAAFEALPDTAPRAWDQRRDGECAWPVDGGGDGVTLSCCAPVARGRAYCARHIEWRRDPEAQLSSEELAREADALVAWLRRRGDR